jgi:hypothetical protein
MQLARPGFGRRRSFHPVGSYFRFLSSSFTVSPPVIPSTWYPVWIFLTLAISARVAVLGSTLAKVEVNPLKVHSEVVCLIHRCFIESLISFTTYACIMTALLGTKVPTPIA